MVHQRCLVTLEIPLFHIININIIITARHNYYFSRETPRSALSRRMWDVVIPRPLLLLSQQARVV